MEIFKVSSLSHINIIIIIVVASAAVIVVVIIIIINIIIIRIEAYRPRKVLCSVITARSSGVSGSTEDNHPVFSGVEVAMFIKPALSRKMNNPLQLLQMHAGRGGKPHPSN
jgi:predicted transcriptional regulator